MLSAAPAVVDLRRDAEPAISICMVLYRGGRLAREALAAVAAYTDVPYEVIVVDNASPDASGPLVRAGCRGLCYVGNAANVGFGPAMNQAVALARAPAVCLLNPDTEVGPAWASPLLARASNAGVGAVTPLLVEPDGVTVQEAGGVIGADGLSYAVGSERWPDATGAATARVVDYASAACLVVRRDAFERVGGFDPRYHLAYYEDADLAFALADVGLRVWFEPATQVRHMRGGTDETGQGWRLAAANQARFVEKWDAELRRRPGSPSGPAERVALRDWKVAERVTIVADDAFDVTAVARRWRGACPHGGVGVIGPVHEGWPPGVEAHGAQSPDEWATSRGVHDDVVVLGDGPSARSWRHAVVRGERAPLVVNHDADPAVVVQGLSARVRSSRFHWTT